MPVMESIQQGGRKMNGIIDITSPGGSWARSPTLYFQGVSPVMLAPHGAHCPVGELLRASKTDSMKQSQVVRLLRRKQTLPKMERKGGQKDGAGGFSEECHLY